ncbi:phosphoglucomutase/phosphomannomutase PgmG [Sphingomonas bacterium]|uniref:phosphoglucomutase/phosphomannomutase PgmG n=1 Tax=Sphingomonas bacterium TaxID=1895847 RepID=UPI0015776CEE|nr:phosphomannomutase/phosphoglucomutase [Sphingomonas bacterium]
MAHVFHPGILREYDIRGVVGRTLGETDAHALGRGFATRVRRVGGMRVAVGYDGRLSSPMLEAALVAGLRAGGVDVVRIGLGPSPMLYFAEATLEVDGAVQVTGSHNPGDHNGFKMVLQHRAFFGDDIQDIAALAVTGDWTEGAGSVANVDVLDTYVERLAEGAIGAYRIGWDCGNGAAGPVIEQLVKLLPGEHHLLFTQVDGNFPNHHPDPGVEANLSDLKHLVAAKRLDFGLAFDGDGDRIGAVDALGRVVWGDQILAVLAEPVLRAHPGATVIADVKASRHLFERIAELGGKPVMTRTGHSVIKSEMAQTGAQLAGEMSGHIFFADDYYGYDDAAYAAVRLIRAIHESGRSLTQLKAAMPAVVDLPERRLPVDETRKTAIVGEVLERLTAAGADFNPTDGARVTTPDGWWLLRASNTEAALTIRAEAGDDAGLARLIAAIDAHLIASGVLPIGSLFT